jgi:hypothetical protein
MRAREASAELWDQYGLNLPVDLKGLAEALGIEVVSFPFNGRIREIIIGRTIGVRRGVSRRWFRWYVAHAIGHHQMHVGTSFYLQGWQWVAQAKAERQAEDFAAYLVSGPDGLHSTASEMAIPEEKLLVVRRALQGS